MVTVDTRSVGGPTLDFALSSLSDSLPKAVRLTGLIDLQHLPLCLLSAQSHTVHSTHGDTVNFFSVLLKASLATRQIISLLIHTPGRACIVYPNLAGRPYNYELRYIDLNDAFVKATLARPSARDRGPVPAGLSAQSKLEKSLNAHIIKRGTKTQSPASPALSSTANSLHQLVERLIRGEFRMRRLDSLLSSSLLARLEAILTDALLFKFTLHSVQINDSLVAQIEETLATLIPVLLPNVVHKKKRLS